MAYEMDLRSSSFYIPKSNFDSAYNALKAATREIKWLHLENVNTFEDAMCECGWNIGFDDFGNADDVDKLYSDYELSNILFNAIGPYVRAGSFIEICGENLDIWRWYFDGVRCIFQIPTFIWHEQADTDTQSSKDVASAY